MKRTLKKHMIAAVSAAMLTMSLSAGVMAAENQPPQPPAGIEQQAPAPQNDGGAPAQDQQQMPPQDAPQNGEKPEGEKPEGEKPEGEKPEGEKPEGEMPEGEQPEGEQPASADDQNGQQLPPGENGQKQDMQMKDNGVEKALTAVNGLEDEDQKAGLQTLFDAYKAALDEADKATDETSRKEAMTAADEAREALNTALTEAGIDAQITTANEDPAELPAEIAKDTETEKKADQNTDNTSKEVQKTSDAGTMNLFRQFLQWLKGFTEKI